MIFDKFTSVVVFEFEFHLCRSVYIIAEQRISPSVFLLCRTNQHLLDAIL